MVGCVATAGRHSLLSLYQPWCSDFPPDGAVVSNFILTFAKYFFINTESSEICKHGMSISRFYINV